MLQVRLVAVGGLKERFWREAVAEYAKRLSRYCRLEIIEVEDEAAPEHLSEAQAQQVLAVEGQRIAKRLDHAGHVILLDIHGQQLDSPGIAARLEALAMYPGRVALVIGGSLGVSGDIKAMAQEQWSFSPLTFPHQLARVMLLEQLYRGFRIGRGEPYHK